jgi:hypothetical protein
MVRKGNTGESECKGSIKKINKDKMMLAKIESWEQKNNIMLSKSKLKEKKVRGCI